MTKIYRECIQCTSNFYIKESDQVFFQETCACGHDRASHEGGPCAGCRTCPEFKALDLPKRCWPCRQRNRRIVAEAKARQAHEERVKRIEGSRRTGRSPRKG
jgi:hypothetical protein